MNSGERGASSTFLSLLTKQDALDSLRQTPYSNFQIKRMVGGGCMDSMRSALGWVHSKLPAVRGALEQVQNPIRPDRRQRAEGDRLRAQWF